LPKINANKARSPNGKFCYQGSRFKNAQGGLTRGKVDAGGLSPRNAVHAQMLAGMKRNGGGKRRGEGIGHGRAGRPSGAVQKTTVRFGRGERQDGGWGEGATILVGDLWGKAGRPREKTLRGKKLGGGGRKGRQYDARAQGVNNQQQRPILILSE